ncbi:MAG: hypothetical protein KZQ95_17855 [Candidatus Thiodiazotropha sp. (ex Epidulcina cf. delphinae)]|nr:hypothetical protein [Candidatus Thiodiazotropha sp. (ex Epidulcina cf. delphinae)]
MDPASPQAAGTTVVFTAQGQGGNVGQYEYQFWHYGPDTGGAWQIQDWSTANTYTLTTTKAASVGSHTVQVRVRNVGSTASYEAYRQ